MSLETQSVNLILNATSIKHDGFIQYLLSSKCYDTETGFFSVKCEIPTAPYTLYEGLNEQTKWLLPKALKQHAYALFIAKETRHVQSQDFIYCSEKLNFGTNLVGILQSIPTALDESLLFEYLNINHDSDHQQALFWNAALGELSDGSDGKYVVDLFGLPSHKQSKIASRFNSQDWLQVSIDTLCERKENQLCYAVSRQLDDKTQYLAFDTDTSNKPINLEWREQLNLAFLFAKVPYSQVQEITSAYEDAHQINKVLKEHCDYPNELDALENMLPFLQTMDASVKLDWFTLNE
ncbi:hypothetical protein [Vibrio gangliei]|uniref:hypothetical protein n=1 Tax=Vibrio gangliei TaxID=2077090 RepID=UPI000D01CDC3|nr:hypothetical protein [Vibrio gangliei]